jgi:hypothetical protein
MGRLHVLQSNWYAFYYQIRGQDHSLLMYVTQALLHSSAPVFTATTAA